jgi:hypothetical protein
MWVILTIDWMRMRGAYPSPRLSSNVDASNEARTRSRSLYSPDALQNPAQHTNAGTAASTL